MAPLPDAFTSMAAMVYGHNGKIYMFGGDDPNTGTVVNTTRIYDIASNTWSSGTPLPDVRAFAGFGYYHGGIFIAGGYSTGNVDSGQNTLWRYDIASDSWNTSLPVVPVALGGFGSGLIDDVLYVAGGRDLGGQYPGVYGYDMENNAWTTLTPMPSPNNVPGTAVFSGQLWVYGGGNAFDSPLADALPDAPDTTSACVAYDPDVDSWSTCPSLLQQRSFPGGTAVRNMPAPSAATPARTRPRPWRSPDRSRQLPDGSGHRIPPAASPPAPPAPPGLPRGEPQHRGVRLRLRTARHERLNALRHPRPWSHTTGKDPTAEAGHTTGSTPADLAAFARRLPPRPLNGTILFSPTALGLRAALSAIEDPQGRRVSGCSQRSRARPATRSRSRSAAT